MFGRGKPTSDPYPKDDTFRSRADRSASEAARREQQARGEIADREQRAFGTTTGRVDDSTSAGDRGGRGGGGLPGRDASTPTDIPKAGWMQIVKRARKETKADNVPLLAGGVAYYAFLALFPAMLATAMIYGLVVSQQTAQSQIDKLTASLPGGVGDMLAKSLDSATKAHSSALSLGLVIGIVAALWAASSGMQGLMKAVNLAYDETETRKFFALRGRALLLSIGAIVFLGVAVGLIAVLPAVVKSIGLGTVGSILANVVRWVVLLAFVIAALAIVYRYAPDRDEPKFKWVSVGSVVAGVLWLVASGLFALYINHFSSYDKTYGSVAAVVVLLLWLYLTAYIVLFGAEVNSEMEHQTARDTTKGPEQPMGTRGAEMADTLPDGDRAGADSARR